MAHTEISNSKRNMEGPPLKRGVVCLLGLLLLVAAGLKLLGQNVQPVAQHGFLHGPAVQLAVVEWELVLGIWLLTSFRPVGAWAAAMLTFVAFAGVSLSLGLTGQTTCGCFGTAEVSPWHAFSVDIIALVLLVVARPSFRGSGSLTLRQRFGAAVRESGVAVAAVAVFSVVVGVASLAYGSPEAALARLRGERVSVRPGVVDVGSGQEGETLATRVEVVNRTDRPVRLLGGSSDCSCVATADLPLALGSGEAREISIQVRVTGSRGIFHRQAFLWTDCDQARVVRFEITGRARSSR